MADLGGMAPAYQRLYIPGRTIPSFFMRNWRVDRFIPRRAAAPRAPGNNPLGLFQRVKNGLSRSASSRVRRLAPTGLAAALV